MKKLAIALLAATALSMPAMAASNQQPQGQQSQMQPPANHRAQDQQQSNQQPSAQQNNTDRSGQNNQAANDQTIAPQSLSRGDVRQVQQALDKDGFKVGRVDGHWGRKTSDAVKQFQQSKNIQANGQLDRQTVQDLGLNNIGKS